MKFLSDIPNIIAWDGAMNKPIQFKDGVYETEDYRIAFLLERMGFKYQGDMPEPTELESDSETDEEPEREPDIDYDAMNKPKIESILTKKGISYSKRMTKDELVELLKGGD